MVLYRGAYNDRLEASSREHAALEPRFLGGTPAIASSFAHIHDADSKK